MSPKTLSLTCGNRLEEIAGVTERIEAFGAMHGLAAGDLFKLTLALDEVVTNIISYAYDDPNEHQIEIRMDRHPPVDRAAHRTVVVSNAPVARIHPGRSVSPFGKNLRRRSVNIGGIDAWSRAAGPA